MRHLPVPLCALVLFAVSACGHDNPAGPSQSLPGTTPVSLAISGNATFTHLGETSRLTATVTFKDGSTRDVTSEVSWYPRSGDDSGVVAIEAGLMTAVRWGRSQFGANYAASYRRVSASLEATVMPPGHFLLKGHVAEGGFALSGANVQLTTSTGEQYSTVSDNALGSYQLPALGPVTIRAEKAGYAATIKQLTVDRDQDFDIDMRRAEAAGDIRGVYTLTMTASSSCKLPAEVMQRHYTARIDESQGKVIVDVGDADMEAWGRAGFSGTRDGSTLHFSVGANYLDDEMFVELVKPNYHLEYNGTATESVDARRITGTFNGWMHYRGPTYSDVVECQASDHRMEFVR